MRSSSNSSSGSSANKNHILMHETLNFYLKFDGIACSMQRVATEQEMETKIRILEKIGKKKQINKRTRGN